MELAMNKVGCSQEGRVVKRAKKKQVKDDLDRQKQAEKKKRRLEKALANSAAIISELEKKKQKKIEEQKRLDDEGAAIAEAVALHVIGEDSDEPCGLMLNHHFRWSYSTDSNPLRGPQNFDGFPAREGYLDNPRTSQMSWIDWGIEQSLPYCGYISEMPYFPGACQATEFCPGYIAAEAVSSLHIREDPHDILSSHRPRTTSILSRMLSSGRSSSNSINI